MTRYIALRRIYSMLSCYQFEKQQRTIKTTVQHVTQDNLSKSKITENIYIFNKNLLEKLKHDNFILDKREVLRS